MTTGRAGLQASVHAVTNRKGALAPEFGTRVSGSWSFPNHLRDCVAANALHFPPFKVNLLQKVKSPFPAQAPAGMAQINDGARLLLVESNSGHDDDPPGIGITLAKVVPVPRFEKGVERSPIHNLVGFLQLELSLQSPDFLVEMNVVGDRILESTGRLGEQAVFRSPGKASRLL